MSDPKKKYRSKFFRVAVEGDTTDGRVIERGWIQQMAGSYNPSLYGARINLEHIRGILPDSPFKAYGDVVAVKAEEVDIDGKKKLALFAQLEPTDALVSMVNNDKQKIYTSIEVSPNFAKTGGAYLVGLAVTDSPASLGTEKLSFAAKHPEAKLFDDRKLNAENVFTASCESSIELEEVSADGADATGKLLSGIAGLLDRFTGKANPPPAPVTPPAPEGAPDAQAFAGLADVLTGIAESIKDQGAQFAALRKDLDESRAEFSALETKLSSTASTTQAFRPVVNGQNGQTGQTALTDC
ncbi:GPO family capsid scaffolding protein [Stenotrophomonas sp. TWI273]|uniref:GPO family capsid scaffolding protein n=1 Tax=Stenotrophomonas sp. TWI273 TaxID=3136774 RepID=UPI00320930F0